VGRLDLLFEKLCVTEYARKKIVEVVCDAAGERSDRFAPLPVRQLSFQSALFGQVVEKYLQYGLLLFSDDARAQLRGQNRSVVTQNRGFSKSSIRDFGKRRIELSIPLLLLHRVQFREMHSVQLFAASSRQRLRFRIGVQYCCRPYIGYKYRVVCIFEEISVTLFGFAALTIQTRVVERDGALSRYRLH